MVLRSNFSTKCDAHPRIRGRRMLPSSDCRLPIIRLVVHSLSIPQYSRFLINPCWFLIECFAGDIHANAMHDTVIPQQPPSSKKSVTNLGPTTSPASNHFSTDDKLDSSNSAPENADVVNDGSKKPWYHRLRPWRRRSRQREIELNRKPQNRRQQHQARYDLKSNHQEDDSHHREYRGRQRERARQQSLRLHKLTSSTPFGAVITTTGRSNPQAEARPASAKSQSSTGALDLFLRLFCVTKEK